MTKAEARSLKVAVSMLPCVKCGRTGDAPLGYPLCRACRSRRANPSCWACLGSGRWRDEVCFCCDHGDDEQRHARGL